jgi:serine/threonine protein kinase
MDAERWRKIEELYHASLEVGEDQRGAFLQNACQDDQGLRREVESLLSHEARAVDFIETSAFEIAARLMAEDGDKSVCVEADPVQIGAVVSHFRVGEKLGRGGMGVVYRAEDISLGRSVALKFLSSDTARDFQSLERLRREARAASALNHPNICTIYEIGTHGEQSFIAMELVEGETLEQRLQKGALSTEQVLRCATQIARALGKAHKAGFIHRDLKPANIMLTKAGAKLMDFGIAKHAPAPAKLTPQEPKLTGDGTIFGTLHYMAPEQLEGTEADARSDIFSLGEVIYEMATGAPAFSGKSRASLIASILTTEPPPMRARQPMTPSALERTVRKCLAKDPEERWQNASDLAVELQWIAEGGTDPVQPAIVNPRQRERLYGAIALLLMAVMACGFSYSRWTRPPVAVLIAQVPPPHNVQFRFSGGLDFQSLALAPDGHAVAFGGIDEAGKIMLWLRPFDTAEAHPLLGTENAGNLFWSPDSRTIGFFADGKLKTIDASGGATNIIADVPYDMGGNWTRDGTIVFSDFAKGLFEVKAGASPVLLVKVDGVKIHSCAKPQFLPDGKHLIYFIDSDDAELKGTWLASLDGKRERLLTRGVAATFSSGFLLYVRGDALMAQVVNPSSGELKGDPQPLVDHVSVGPGGALFAVSENRLLYQAAGQGNSKQLTWFDRNGRKVDVVGEAGDYFDLRLSPDEQKLALNAGSPYSDIWVDEMAHPAQNRLTIDPGADHGLPVWSPDSRQIVYAQLSGKGTHGMYEKRANGVGAGELLLAAENSEVGVLPTSWSHDGKFLLFSHGTIPQPSGLWILPMTGERKPRQVPNAPESGEDGQFSPDSKWIAFTSRESGTDEIYVIPFDEASFANSISNATSVGGSKWQISAHGGRSPRWRGDGKEIYWLSPRGQIMAAKIENRDGGFEVHPPETVLRAGIEMVIFEPYDVTRDGKKFIVNMPSDQDDSLTLLVNWSARLN